MVFVKKSEGRRAVERVILKLTLMGGCEEDSSGPRWGTVAGSREKDKWTFRSPYNHEILCLETKY
jgi:hypothetical protein